MTASSLQSRSIPSLIQGVSQQSPMQRRDTQCEAQYDCLNSPSLGCFARAGCDIEHFYSGVQVPGAFVYELVRGNAEHYLMALSGGTLRIFDLNTGNLCTVTDTTGADGYLASAGGGVLDVDNFRVQTVSDTTFIINRSIAPAMGAALSPTRPKEALVFFQAGNYLTTYTITLKYNGVLYRWDYTTPDNSVAGNAAYIYTNQLAATFYRALTGAGSAKDSGNAYGVGAAVDGQAGSSGASHIVTITHASPAVVSWMGHGLAAGTIVTFTTTGALPAGITPGASYYVLAAGLTADSFEFSATLGGAAIDTTDDGSGTHTGNAASVTALALGFSVAINGNLLRIWRGSDTNDFTIDVSDGGGDDQVAAFKDTVSDFSKLPKGGFDGFLLKVVGPGGVEGTSSGYYVHFVNSLSSNGYWTECPAPGITTTPDSATMPHTIFCTAPNTFEIRSPAWQPRIAGDGATTSENPGFIGKLPRDIFFHEQRLGIITEGTVDFSKARQVFTFFPDTVQTELATAPISTELAASETTAVLDRSVVIDESLVVWAQRAQFRINSGITSLSPTTIQQPESTAYEFNANANFGKSGTTLHFSYEDGMYSALFNLTYAQGRAAGDTNVTAHVPKYILAGVRRIAPSAPLSLIFVGGDGEPSVLNLYNFFIDGNTLTQSAWNKWRMPAGAIVWHSVYKQYLYLALQRTDGLAILRVPLNLTAADPGGAYLTRLDLRLSESQVSSVTYDPTLDQSTITWGHTLSDDEQALVRVATRTTSANFRRGELFDIVSTLPSSVTVKRNAVGEQFYVGLAISSEREESTFYQRTASGLIPAEELTVRGFKVSHMETGYYRVETSWKKEGGRIIKRSILNPTAVGSESLNVGDPPVLDEGSVEAECDTKNTDLRVRIINDSHLPSRWVTAEWTYQATQRASPRLAPSTGGPIQ